MYRLLSDFLTNEKKTQVENADNQIKLLAKLILI